MTSNEDAGREKQTQRIAIRARRVLDGNGEESVGTTTFCPIQEKSVTIAECEGCNRFYALHFDAVTRASSVVCYSRTEVAGPAEGPSPGKVDGPPDALASLATIMTRDVVCVRPETALDEVRALLLDRGISGVPIVDAEGRPLGIVSRADLLRADRDREDTEELVRVAAPPRPHELEELGLEGGFRVYEPQRLTAGEVMTPVALALHEGANIGQAASLMAFEGVHRLPVVADDGKVVGILSALDVLRWFGQRSGYIIPPRAARNHG